MAQHRIYIDYLLSLRKESFFHPYVVQWVPLYGMEQQERAIQDSRNAQSDHFAPGDRLTDLLSRLTPTIEDYPYVWPLESQSLDPLGFDFYTDSSEQTLEITEIAYEEALRLLEIPPERPDTYTGYTEDKRVSASHLAKIQLSFQKASPLTTLSFQFFAKSPVVVLSVVAEKDTVGNSSPVEVNLANISVHHHEDTATLMFGRPIFAKRLTIVLGQNEATNNTYHVRRVGEDFSYTAVGSDHAFLDEFVSDTYHGRSFEMDESERNIPLKDWSSERRDAYIAWREKIENGGRGE